MIVKVETLAEARKNLAEFEKQVKELEEQLKEAEKENRIMAATVNTMNKIGTYDELIEEVKKLKRREQGLLEYNNEQVERRREIAAELNALKRKQNNDG